MSAIVIDTETTGLDDPAVVEVAWQEIEWPQALGLGFPVVSQFTARVNPGRPISFGAMATHHIRDEDVAGCPPLSEITLPVHVPFWIGHNVDYDWGVLGRPNVYRIDTLALARMVLPEDSHTVGALMYRFYGRSARGMLRDAHSAAADVRMTVLILWHLVTLLVPQPLSWESLWEMSERARVPTVMPYGKHKGQRIADIPLDYRHWLLRQPDVDPYLRVALQS